MRPSISASLCASRATTSASVAHSSLTLSAETAQTAQRFWVRIRSGWSVSSSSRSIAYKGRPSPTASRTALSISKLLNRVVSTREAVTTGRPRTSDGQSHSSEMPTSDSARPSSATISVALGRSEQIRILRLLHAGGQVAEDKSIALDDLAALAGDRLDPGQRFGRERFRHPPLV